MSLTQNDLVIGGFYHKVNDPKFLGCLELGFLGRVFMRSPIKNGFEYTFYDDEWEGIPITPKLLVDWYKVSSDLVIKSGNLRVQFRDWFDNRYSNIIISVGKTDIAVNPRRIDYVHQLQHFVLGFTGEMLKGGPE